jgi:hypothetical protein
MSNSYNFGQEAEMRAADYYHSLGFHILKRIIAITKPKLI